MSKKLNLNRREFVAASAAAGVGYWISGTSPVAAFSDRGKGKEKLNIACFGVGGRGYSNISQMSSENVIAICDVDKKNSENAIKEYVTDRGAKFYTDYRELLDQHGKDLDAVVVSTPDHMHAPIASLAMSKGLHCYCEKPLTWSVEESRVLAALAEQNGLVTQMGNHGTGAVGFRTGVEMLWEQVIGDVTEVHIWTNRPVWPQAIDRPKGTSPVPETLDWDAWLGCAPKRPFHPDYLPFKWRGWYDYGTGALGDMACHTVNLAYMGLKLGAPTTIEATTTKLFSEAFPAGSTITYQFPARDGFKPVKMVWYDGKNEDGSKNNPPQDILLGEPVPGSGCVIVGDKGSMFSPDDYGAKQILLPKEKFPERIRPQRVLPRTQGHHFEWRDAIKKGTATLSNFGHAGPFTEAMILGNLAMRTGKKIDWDNAAMKAKGVPEADDLIRRKYENGHALTHPSKPV